MHGVTGYGNCFINGLWLYFKMGLRGRLIIKTRPNSRIPHLMIDHGDCLWHFRAKKEFLPQPCKHLFFRGRYECLKVGLDGQK